VVEHAAGADDAVAAKEKETEERLLDISKYERGLEKLSHDFGLSFEPSSLPYSAIDGIRRQKRAVIPDGLKVPARARKILYRLVEMRTGSFVVWARTDAEWDRIPALKERAKALQKTYCTAMSGAVRQMRAILYFYGHKQGLTDEQIRAMRAASSRRKQ